MLSRRIIRIKILQLLYARGLDKELTDKDIILRYHNYLKKSFDLYLFTLYLLLKVTEFSEAEESMRKKKHIPNEGDKNFQARLYKNDLIQSLLKNQSLQEKFRKLNFGESLDSDIIRKIYRKYSKDEEYQAYATSLEAEANHKEMLLSLFRFVRKDELFEEILEDNYFSWLDDKSLVIGAIKKTLKNLPAEQNFYSAYLPDDDTTHTFGLKLITNTMSEEEKFLEYIQPRLENWEVERLAVIDMIILKMALCEMIHFESIPTRATINEYVEIAKSYSTEKSKDFINGILDNLMKELGEQGIINKTGRGLQ